MVQFFSPVEDLSGREESPGQPKSGAEDPLYNLWLCKWQLTASLSFHARDGPHLLTQLDLRHGSGGISRCRAYLLGCSPRPRSGRREDELSSVDILITYARNEVAQLETAC